MDFNKNDPKNWTPCQVEALERVLNAKSRGIKRFGLYGGGGVGKTFIASAIIQKLQEGKGEALIIAPTNSAVKSIRRSFADSFITCKLTFKTIHSALGIQPNFDDDGTMRFKSQKDISDWQCSVVFVDEASMVSKELTNGILEQVKRSGAFLIASGDRPQLPPVNEETSSLMDSMEETYTLTTIVRQAHDNPISSVIKHCRDAVESVADKFDPRNEYWESILNDRKFGYHVFYDEDKGIRQVIRAYAKKSYPLHQFDYVKLGAYTNRKCKIHNDYIRQQLWGAFASETEYIPGDLVLCKAPVCEDRIDPITGKTRRYTLMTTGTECIVNKVEPIIKEYRELILNYEIDGTRPTKYEYITHTYKGWRLDITDNDPLDENCEVNVTVEVLDYIERSRFLGNRNRLREECKDYLNKTRKNVWFRFYAHEEIFHQFVHSYCITIHSTQGKTFNTMALDLADICNYAPNNDIRNRLIYVGASRAKENLIII